MDWIGRVIVFGQVCLGFNEEAVWVGRHMQGHNLPNGFNAVILIETDRL
jgi:hypothetical protein